MFLQDFRNYIIKPSLVSVSLWSLSAERLLTATLAVETNGLYLKQIGNVKNGGLGFYQIEPPTHLDIKNWLKNRNNKDLLQRIVSTCYIDILPPDDEPLIYNLRYATLIARLVYFRYKEALPSPDNVAGLVNYYLKYYNGGGKATFEKCIDKFNEVCSY